jgi:hypothetical protein
MRLMRAERLVTKVFKKYSLAKKMRQGTANDHQSGIS